jgi:hypothetical protein
MTSSVSSEAATHEQHVAGVISRYAPLVMLWGIFFGIGLLLASLGLTRPQAGTLLPGFLFLLGSFAFLVPMFLGLSRGARRASTTSEGVEWQDNKGDHRWQWGEIMAVFRLEKIINQTFRVKQLRLVAANGEEVTFDQCLKDYDGFAGRVQDGVAQRLLPAKRSELACGGVPFGPILLQRDGITVNGTKFTWPDVGQSIIFRGRFVVLPLGSRGNGGEAVTLASIPNYTLLLQLMLELGQAPVSG